MNKKSILTSQQKLFFKVFSQNKNFSKNFYLTGGTALAEFYIPYRLSEDLDFFSENEVDSKQILTFFASSKKILGYSKIDFNTSFNRNIFFLNFNKYQLKLEFTYFPFPQVEKAKIIEGVKIDSITDIAVNKLFTIYQNPRSRDFMDLYMIQKKYKFRTDELLKKAKAKFDWHIDLLKLGSQFLLAKELKDYPKLIAKLDEKDWQSHFEKEAKKLGTKILR